MISWYAKAIVSALLILPIGIGMVWLIRKRLTPSFPVGAIGASTAVVAAMLLLIAAFGGLDTSRLFLAILVVAAFTGAICPQPSPWSPSSILRALAISAGSVAVAAVLTANHSATALALLATGVLIKLYSDVSPKRARLSEDIRSGAMSGQGDA